MSDLDTAAVTLGRTRAIGGTIFVVGVPAAEADLPQPAFRYLEGDGAEESIRRNAKAGDSLVIVDGDAVDGAARDRILRRLPAWGVSGVWVGADATRRPADGLVLCLLDADPVALVATVGVAANALAGDAEALAPAVVECTDEVCITCSDEGRLGEVTVVPVDFLSPARVRTVTGDEDVDVTLIGDVAVGDLVLIHAGGAIARVPDNETEAMA